MEILIFNKPSFWDYLRCWKYRAQIERNKWLHKRIPSVRPIDNIEVGNLIVWENYIQLGVDLLNPGGEVHVPAGTHNISTPINLVNSCYIKGSGQSTIIRKSQSMLGILRLIGEATTYKEKLTISDILLDANSQGGGGACIDLRYVKDVNIHNVKINATGDAWGVLCGGDYEPVENVRMSNIKVTGGLYHCIAIYGWNQAQSKQTKSIQLTNFDIEGSSEHGIEVAGAKNVVISNGVTHDNTYDGLVVSCLSAAVNYSCLDVAINNVISSGNRNGFWINTNDLDTVTIEDIRLSNCTAYGNSGSGFVVRAESGTSLIKDSSFIGNKAHDNDYGLRIIGDVQNCDFIGGYFHDNTTRDVHVNDYGVTNCLFLGLKYGMLYNNGERYNTWITRDTIREVLEIRGRMTEERLDFYSHPANSNRAFYLGVSDLVFENVDIDLNSNNRQIKLDVVSAAPALANMAIGSIKLGDGTETGGADALYFKPDATKICVIYTNGTTVGTRNITT